MANNTQGDLIFYASINKSQLDRLGNIRMWDNVKMAYEDDIIWLKDLTEEQTDSNELLSIPNCKFYYTKENKLFPKGSILPCDNIPTPLWTPIARALLISLPAHNNNFMGLGDPSLDICIMPSDKERETFAILVAYNELSEYIQNAPDIRMRNLKWTILSEDTVLIVGLPLLPINGTTFWKHKQILLPTGYDFNYPILSDMINDKYATADSYLCWQRDNKCIKIDTSLFENLSRASFRLTETQKNE